MYFSTCLVKRGVFLAFHGFLHVAFYMFGKKCCNSGISGFLHAFFVVFLLLL